MKRVQIRDYVPRYEARLWQAFHAGEYVPRKRCKTCGSLKEREAPRLLSGHYELDQQIIAAVGREGLNGVVRMAHDRFERKIHKGRKSHGYSPEEVR